MSSEQRQHYRIPVHIAAMLVDVAGLRNDAVITNLTSEGCGMKVTFPPRDGGHVTLTFNVPGRHITCLAHVCARRGDVYGLQFIEIDRMDRIFIQAYLYVRMQAMKFRPAPEQQPLRFKVKPRKAPAARAQVATPGRGHRKVTPVRNSWTVYLFALLSTVLIALVATASNNDNDEREHFDPNGGSGHHYGWDGPSPSPAPSPAPTTSPAGYSTLPEFSGVRPVTSFVSDYTTRPGPITLNGGRIRRALSP